MNTKKYENNNYCNLSWERLKTDKWTFIRGILPFFYSDWEYDYAIFSNDSFPDFNGGKKYGWIRIGDKEFKEYNICTNKGLIIEYTDCVYINISNMTDIYFNVITGRTSRVIKYKDPERKILKTNLWNTIKKIEKWFKYKDSIIYIIELEGGKEDEDEEDNAIYTTVIKHPNSDELVEINLFCKRNLVQLEPIIISYYGDFIIITNDSNIKCSFNDNDEVYSEYPLEYRWTLIIEKKTNVQDTYKVKTWWFSNYTIHRVSDYVTIEWRTFYKAMNKKGEIAYIEKWLEQDYIKIRNAWFDNVGDIFYDKETQKYYYQAMLGGQKTPILLFSNEMKDVFDKAHTLLEKASRLQENWQRLKQIQEIRQRKIEELKKIEQEVWDIYSDIKTDSESIKEINEEKNDKIVQVYKDISEHIKNISE